MVLPDALAGLGIVPRASRTDHISAGAAGAEKPALTDAQNFSGTGCQSWESM